MLQPNTGRFVQLYSHVPDFVPTPDWLVRRAVKATDILPGMTLLEPSAGDGRLAKAARKKGAVVTCVELSLELGFACQDKGLSVEVGDFLEWRGDKFDRVLMFPPFSNGAAFQHVCHALKFLKPNGWLTAIVPTNMQSVRGELMVYAVEDDLPKIGSAKLIVVRG